MLDFSSSIPIEGVYYRYHLDALAEITTVCLTQNATEGRDGLIRSPEVGLSSRQSVLDSFVHESMSLVLHGEHKNLICRVCPESHRRRDSGKRRDILFGDSLSSTQASSKSAGAQFDGLGWLE
jgi:hypothetical protein